MLVVFFVKEGCNNLARSIFVRVRLETRKISFNLVGCLKYSLESIVCILHFISHIENRKYSAKPKHHDPYGIFRLLELFDLKPHENLE